MPHPSQPPGATARRDPAPRRSHRIYLDHAATSPLRSEVAEAMLEVLHSGTGNPSSPHEEGRRARRRLTTAREEVAGALGVPTPWIVFTRGGTESDNLAVLGRAAACPEGALVISAVEHSAVRESAAHLARRGRHVVILPVLADGGLEPGAMEAALSASPQPALVSVQSVNSETGLILRLDPLLARAAELHLPVHVDAVQALGRVPLPLPLPIPAGKPPGDAFRPPGASLLTLSLHKVGGPAGVGILVRDPSLSLTPLLFGGNQEEGLRPGTEDVTGAVGAAVAISLAMTEQATEAPRLTALRQRLESGLSAGIPGLRIHGGGGTRAPHILSVGVPGVPRDLLPGALDLEGIAVSAGSACRSGSLEVSPTLAALHGKDAGDYAPVRLSLGRETTSEDVERALAIIPGVLDRTRRAFGE